MGASRAIRSALRRVCDALGIESEEQPEAEMQKDMEDGSESMDELAEKQASDSTAVPVRGAAGLPMDNTSTVLPSLESTTDDHRMYIPLTHTSAPVIGVIILLATTSIGGAELRGGIVGSDNVKPYDVLALFICLAYIAISLDSTGLLRYLACIVCQKASFDGRVFYIVLYLFLWVAGLILGNDPVILSGTPLLVYITQMAGISPPSAWVWGEFVAANVASAVLVSSNLTNIVIATGFKVSFVTYTAYMALPSLAGAVFAMLALMVFFSMFKSDTGTEFIPKKITRPDINARKLLTDPMGAAFSSVVMLAVIGTLIGTSVHGGPEVYQIGVPGAVLCLIRDMIYDANNYRHKAATEAKPVHGLKRIGAGARWVYRVFPTAWNVLRKLPVSLLPFAFGMFILVQALEHVGFVSIMARGVARVCAHGVAQTTFFMALLSIILCSVGGTNVGSTILLTKVMQSPAFTQAIAPSMRDSVVRSGMYATALGSNLGAMGGTFAASLAGLLWKGILVHHGIHVRVFEFFIWSIVAVFPAAGAAFGVLLAEMYFFTV
ncbi:hypothetical protein MCUN1_002528 [Malassezia cuniculi]|uniref:Citrate transporter-like domain-containing protein n=1 Tax=Malassezia cuniculi TaxID=948313 RepID=A0AAF0J6L1_9BASI|nr:hypothetical protein MCUN1_002528 [Malassezia cuniculi]